MLDRMNLLFRFQAIAEAGSVRKAVEVLNITQPALSRSLSQLEQAYGQPLLERHARGVRPTAFGHRLLSTITRLSRDWELAELELASNDTNVQGRLRLSAGPLWSALVLPTVIKDLHRSYPNLTVEIGHGSGEALPALLDGRIDAIFGGMHPIERSGGRLASRAFTTVRDRLVARTRHPIHKRRPDDYDAVLAYPWIIFTADPIYEAETLHSVVERTGAVPQVRVRSTSLTSVLALLQEGDYLCVLPTASMHRLPGIRPAPVELGRRTAPSGALYRRAIEEYPPFQALLDLCAAYFEGQHPDEAGG